MCTTELLFAAENTVMFVLFELVLEVEFAENSFLSFENTQHDEGLVFNLF